MKHALFDSRDALQFAGHETFPLRILWLKKAFDAIQYGAPTGTFQERSAIGRFGVGRNMAVSMKYWAFASGVMEEVEKELRPTAIASLILSDDGADPYIERPATVWLVHWAIASTPQYTTTAYYAFNGMSANEFDSHTLSDEVFVAAEARDRKTSIGTIKRDVEVFLRSYVRKEGGATEDTAEPLLAELGLIREARFGGWFEFVRGPKPSLPDAIFAYALAEFWDRFGGGNTLTVEHICYAPGAPGRVFKLDEDSVVTRLMAMEKVTGGAWIWTDTAGLRQIQRAQAVEKLDLVRAAYPKLAKAVA
ncbi:MAG: hypothetical protein B7Z26_00410 [Asticcacaulis sp. 32-58-5]|nr:MAG: hypothetical protein B7Z26_00410 [Asticcacaulis sp. 32-58-5]